MLKVAIVDDEQQNLDQCKKFLEKYGEENNTVFRIFCFSNGLDFISEYTDGYDIVFMDIAMPHFNGLEAATLLRKRDPNVCLIFVTNLAKYAIRGYEVDATDFFIKPINYATFSLKMARIMEKVKNTDDEQYFVVDGKSGLMKVLYSDVYYITVSGRYTVLHTKNGEVDMRISMKELEQRLAGSFFVRGDNSSMVNLMYVTEIKKDGAIVNGEFIPCSRKRKKALLDAFTLYLR